MAEHLIWSVGNRNPSITENIVDSAGAPVDLTGSTVRFKMRPVGSDTLDVDQPATIVTPAAGTVRYDWLAADVDTEGFYLVWWEVTTGGKTQDVGEAVIEFRAHAPADRAYVEVEEFKSTLELTGTSFADADVRSVLVSASRALEETFGSRWWTTAAADPDEVRYYNPESHSLLVTDEIVELTELATDDQGGTTFGTVWTLNTDFVLEPLNADTDGRPWWRIRAHPNGSRCFSPNYPRSVRVTGRFGWATTPEGVKVATSIIAHQVLKRKREAPYGIVNVGGEALRISRFDSDVERAMTPYDRRVSVG